MTYLDLFIIYLPINLYFKNSKNDFNLSKNPTNQMVHCMLIKMTSQIDFYSTSETTTHSQQTSLNQLVWIHMIIF